MSLSFARVPLSVRLSVPLSVLAFAVAALGVVTIASPASATGVPVARTAAASPSIDSEVYERKIRTAINRQRDRRDLRPLRFERCTDDVAERWSGFLARTMSRDHQAMSKVLATCDATWAGETLAKGSVSPRKMVRTWMSSPGHRAILLSKAPRRIGIGAHPDATGAWVVAANFTRF